MPMPVVVVHSSSKPTFSEAFFYFQETLLSLRTILGSDTYVDLKIRVSLNREKLTFKSASYCDNETVDGVEFPNFPESLEPRSGEDERLVVADMSSNFLSRQVPISKYAVIFGGVQKFYQFKEIKLLTYYRCTEEHR